MCEDKKLPGVKKYTIAACYEVCKQTYIAKTCKCQPFYMRGNCILYIAKFMHRRKI